MKTKLKLAVMKGKRRNLKSPSDNQNEVCALLKSTPFCVLLYENKTYSL